MINSNLEELLQKFATGKINPAELAELQRLMMDDAAMDVLDAFLQKAYQDPSLAVKNDFDKQQAFKTIGRRLRSSSKRGVRPSFIRKRMIYAALGTAAMLLLGWIVLYFFLQPQPVQSNKEAVAVSGDIYAPQANRATVTMSDGTVMYLDSAGNGQLATQAATRLIKLANGVIAYEMSGQKAPSTAPVYNTINNPRGSRVINIILSDGSKIWLNAGSSITYPVVFADSERQVQLKGEGYFEVAKNEHKKFIVTSANTITEVLGTHFNINAYEDERAIKITLLEGRVAIGVPGVSGKTALTPGMQARVVNNTLRTLRNVDVRSETAWKDGYFSFHNADMKEVLRQLARWYDLTVEYRGVIPDREFEGEMQQDLMLSQALKILEKNKVNFKTEGKKIIIMP
ncbi:hypothetical protein A8C56_01560 [Niabella ginsenosidivorans]|uniref:Iron dicitrate transport regulator FecR n=1 Tax=Niabella ginsenosidivorans TaxID=1176587 RepID=A0A1A9HXN0_9BACT|nr:FecR family protein [Niabella ginsenosidivorans]ANH79835.1 hypothetical protein A8C56_01560 [Niabella ginsenosidivorans]